MTDTPAFPVVAERIVHSKGMTLRDYFAAQALAGFTSSQEFMLNAKSNNRGLSVATCVATMAYEVADAMMKAREASND